MANRRPSSQAPSGGNADDAFTANVLRFWGWARNRTELLVAAVVVVILLGGGLFYFMNQQRQERAAAAAELETIQQSMPFADREELTGDLRDFLARYGGTPYAVEARLVLGEILLEQGSTSEAISTLSEVAPSFRDPLRLQATILLAVAYEEAEEWDDAADVYGQLREEAEFPYQRHDAAEGLARVHLAQGDTSAAVEVYRQLLQEIDAESEERDYVDMRLAELQSGT